MHKLHHRVTGYLPVAKLEPLLSSERALLREVRSGDADLLRRYCERNADRFGRFESPPGNPTALETWVHERVFQGQMQTSRCFIAFLRGALADPIGVVCFDSISVGSDSSAILSFSIDRDCEGSGLAYEIVSAASGRVFEAFDVRTLVAYHHTENARSAALLGRLGFRIVATADVVPPDLAAFVRPQVLLTLRRPD
jgi:RimJ/RimL family protein N-acetyltransferase